MTEAEAISAIQNDLKWHSKELKPKYKEALRMAIDALEAIEKIKFIINEKHYPNAEECDYGQYYRCEKALMIADIEDVLSALDSEV